MTNSVAKASAESMANNAAVKKVRTLRGGVEAMRAAGETYLPKEEKEDAASYDARRARSWLFPALNKTIGDTAGKVFAKEVAVGEDVPPQIADLTDDITNDGRKLNTFAREVFEDGTEVGVSFILVDSPMRSAEMTRAEEQAINFRPYMSLVKAEDILGWKTDTENNATILKQVRISETVTEDGDDEFTQVSVDQIRVLTRDPGGVSVRLYRQNEKKDKWILFEEFMTGVSEITIAPFYTNRTGFMTGHPIFESLADLNIAHWQSASDQRNILHKARVPILFFSGISADEVTMGANSAMVSSSPDAKGMWVEHSGAAIGAGRDDLKDLEQRMAILGLQLSIPKPGNNTATGEALDAAKANTPLAMMANSLKDTLETALGFMADYMGLEDGGSVEVNTDFGINMLGEQDQTFLLNAVNTGQISHATFIEECKRRNILMDSVNSNEEQELIDASMPEVEGLADIDDEDEPNPTEAFLKVVNGGVDG